MNFNEFWTQLQSELNPHTTFRTSTQDKKFNAYFDHNKKGDLFVRVILESGKQRGQIPANEFQGVWNNARILPNNSTRFVNKDGRLNSYTKQDEGTGTTKNLSYIVALIKYIIQNQEMQ